MGVETLLTKNRTSIVRATILIIAAIYMLVFSIAPVYGAPGTPGVPSDPTVIFEENFQNRAPDSNILLTDYTGTSGMTYSADPYWIDRSVCNGLIVNFNSPYSAPDCGGPPFGEGVYNNMLSLTYALGLYNGADPEAFPAVSAYSGGPGPGNAIQFQTNDKIPLSSSNRFVSFSVDVAAVNCDLDAQPLLRFYLVDEQDNEMPITDGPDNPCTNPNAQTMEVQGQSPPGGTFTVRVGTLISDGSILFSGTELGILLRNEETLDDGNDTAYTNIRVLDVSPQLDKIFDAGGEYTPGDDIPVTFTVTNTSDLVAKQGWSFTDNLPAGLVIADSPNVSSSCSNGSVNAIAGSSSFNVSGDLQNGQESCEVTLNLTATSTGTFTNGPTNISAVGLNLPGEATVTVTEGLADTGQSQQLLVAAAGLLIGTPVIVVIFRRQILV